MKLGKEEIIQVQVCEWLKQLHPEIPFIHIANQRSCSAMYGMILKRMGVKKGVSDLFLPKGKFPFKGLWLELKSEKGKLSDFQADFMDEMREYGYDAHVAYGFDEAISIIKQFYEISS